MCAITTKKAKSTLNGQQAQKQSPQQSKSTMCCSAENNLKNQQNASFASSHQNAKSTKIIVKFNCGFQNKLSIRGEGIQGLNWNHGCPMKNVKADEWCWETNESFKEGQFKILINDKQYEQGENHWIQAGKSVTLVPKF